ncbi:Tungsten-containing aldehyde:ferredoxin oxidoreductase [Candidatus Syntrophocurvum alkaliphilum]|uniref:Tungsten-containing aldehyde:ferredoxin oxidoreductase n=1 Tax=Candidatus Syntrophocurvum alkaliphilum TaxID=2293317 RepID=A0A6I6D839_9FIRM|nr:aldehyde ferredoxin oxidoreductase family protein [Candidatus Syntrophocurvum alkaliphilum]QGT98767.1 Tungsten-containing aldehyde:ferredoxin oxidoreductase [Candidatus Syntrophocurvum alkaliphilum]
MQTIKIIEINLSTHNSKVYYLNQEQSKRTLGGMGVNAELIYERLKNKAVDPLGPENILVFSAGTLTGTGFPTGSRTEASAKSPLTGRFGTSNSGFFFGGNLKRAGYDTIVLTGQSDQPVYLVLSEQDVQFKDATKLWGIDAWECTELLETEYPKSSIATIGNAGENLVRYASIQNGRNDAWGRTGLGAVMGSKNLKAIIVNSNKKVSTADPDKYKNICKTARQMVRNSPFHKPFKQFGTLGASAAYGKFGALPTRNFSGQTIPEWAEKYGKNLLELYSRSHMTCESCWIACGHMVDINKGKYQGDQLKALEITPTITFCAQCSLSAEASFKATELCQRFGMDMVSAGSTVAMAFNLYEDGKLSKEEIGYSLQWGDEEAFIQLLTDIALGNGIGKILAKGSAEAEKLLNSDGYAMQIKNLEIPMIDPRGRWSTYSFGMLSNIRGGDHLRCRNPFENLRFNLTSSDMLWEAFKFPVEYYEQADIVPASLKKEIIDLENSRVNIPKMGKWSEDLITVFNSLGICIRPPILNAMGPTFLAEAYSVATGIDMSPIELMQSGERTWNLIKLYNLAEGEHPDDSKFPKKFFIPADGVKDLDESTVEAALKSYYAIRGWDEQGVPQQDKLSSLNI